jgi:hypothetical protein
MKKNRTILIFSLGIALITISFKTTLDREPNALDNVKQDTTYYHVYIGVERGVTEEFIKTYEYNTELVADIFVINYQEFSYIGKPTIRNYIDSNRVERLILTSRKIDTLNVFKNMVETNAIRHNQGLKIAGRYGSYSVISNGDTVKVESSELYSLVDAINFVRK